MNKGIEMSYIQDLFKKYEYNNLIQLNVSLYKNSTTGALNIRIAPDKMDRAFVTSDKVSRNYDNVNPGYQVQLNDFRRSNSSVKKLIIEYVIKYMGDVYKTPSNQVAISNIIEGYDDNISDSKNFKVMLG